MAGPIKIGLNTKKPSVSRGFFNGGAEGNRTHDLLNAIQALSQLSYSPSRLKKIRNLLGASRTTESSFINCNAHIEIVGCIVVAVGIAGADGEEGDADLDPGARVETVLGFECQGA